MDLLTRLNSTHAANILQLVGLTPPTQKERMGWKKGSEIKDQLQRLCGQSAKVDNTVLYFVLLQRPEKRRYYSCLICGNCEAGSSAMFVRHAHPPTLDFHSWGLLLSPPGVKRKRPSITH